jgi:hypothetical protein
LLFDHSLDQSHGLIADPSGRGQQDQVDLILFKRSRHFRSSLFDQGCDMSPVDMAHEAVVGCCERPDPAFGDELPETVKRDDDIGVLFGVAVIVIIMGDVEISGASSDLLPEPAC